MANFLKNSGAAATALRAGLHSGVPDHSVAAIAKCLRNPQRLDGDDSLSKGSPYVVERVTSPSVNAIKKIHQGGARRETGDTLMQLRKSFGGPALRDVQLPSQSSNGQWQDADPRRVGGALGVADVDRQFGAGVSPTQGAPRQAESIGSRSAGPQDSDVPDKRKPRDRARRALARDNIEGPLDATPDSDCLDACGKAIRELHRQGARPLFERR